MKRLELIEMPGHVGLMALGQDWMTERHYYDLMTACCLGYDMSQPGDEIHELSLRGTELLTSKSTNYDEMRSVIGTVVQWIATQPNQKIWNATMRRLKLSRKDNG
jgi:hypothetical protein